MTGFRKLVAIVVAASLIPLGFPQQAQAKATKEHTEEFRQKVEQLGVGAELRIGLKDSRLFRGTVESFEDSVFRLQLSDTGDLKTFRYVDLALLELTKKTYRAEGSPDPAIVRRVAVELGVGRKVGVQTQDGKRIGGRITKLDKEQLNLDVGGSGPMSVPYAQIRELKPKGTSIWVKAGIVAGVLTILMVVSLAVMPH